MTSEKPKKNFFSPPTRKSFFIDLSKHYLELLNSSNNFDVIIRIGEGDNYREFNAHSFILNRRSIYFNKVLSKNNWTKMGDKIILEKQNISPQVFEIILK